MVPSLSLAFTLIVMLTGAVNVAPKVGLVRFTVGAALGREATMMLTGFDVLGADAS